MTAPMLESKPTYPEFFDLVAGLPPEIKSNVCYLLLWIWRHTNSDQKHENFGKAWMAHPNLAREMHASRTVIPEWFNEAWAWGLINREHLFKKKGKVIVSDAPYRMKTSHGRGEYLGSRYWIDWAFVQELQVKGVPESGRPNELGYRNSIAQAEIGVPESGTPVPESGTKGLIEGFDLPPTTDPSVEAREGEDKSEGLVVDSSLPKSQKRGQQNLLASPEDHAESLIAASRARQLDRKMTDAAIFREYKKVFDRLEQEYQARENFEPKAFRSNDPRAVGLELKGGYALNPEYAAMPQGAHFEKGLVHTAKHRHDAADLYRTLGRDAALAKWEDFLVNENHETTTGVPLFGDDGYTPTGQFISETVERTWLLYDFVVYCGVHVCRTGSSHARCE